MISLPHFVYKFFTELILNRFNWSAKINTNKQRAKKRRFHYLLLRRCRHMRWIISHTNISVVFFLFFFHSMENYEHDCCSVEAILSRRDSELIKKINKRTTSASFLFFDCGFYYVYLRIKIATTKKWLNEEKQNCHCIQSHTEKNYIKWPEYTMNSLNVCWDNKACDK